MLLETPVKSQAKLNLSEAENQTGIDVLEAAQRCGYPITRKKDGKLWEMRCPFCGDSKEPAFRHLYFEPERGTFYCYRCNEFGEASQLYSELQRIISSKGKQACRES